MYVKTTDDGSDVAKQQIAGFEFLTRKMYFNKVTCLPVRLHSGTLCHKSRV